MGLLDWVKRGRNAAKVAEPRDEPAGPRHFTRKGNAIDVVSQGEWLPNDTGQYEFRHHVGKSMEGFHGGVEVSHGGDGPFTWSNARPTPEAAEKASYRMREGYEHGYEKRNTANRHDPSSKPDKMPFRYQKPFAHMYYDMTADERKVVDGIEARWRERYDGVKDYPPMSEGQEQDFAVFKAVDGVNRTLDARENGAFKDWKRLEADVEKAFGKVRQAFGEQRKYVGREIAGMQNYNNQMAPDSEKERGSGTREKTPSWER